jgi:hypothetical protein
MWRSMCIRATTLAAVRHDSGRVIARAIVPTEAGALVEFVRGMRGAIHLAFEEGTQAQWLHDLLVPLVDRVVVCDRRGQRRQGNKNDAVDAAELAELLRRGALRAVYHGSGHRATLKELTRTYQHLVEDATRVMLRLKALFRARGLKTPVPRARGLNRNHNRVLKNVFKGAATAATARPGPLQEARRAKLAAGGCTTAP